MTFSGDGHMADIVKSGTIGNGQWKSQQQLR